MIHTLHTDPLYHSAVEYLILNGGNVSTLQRKLRIGYQRASRLISRMEEEGVIGSMAGYKYKILMTMDEWRIRTFQNQ
jgi:S-DNA-T family DNA segregation ATPase FtsK/SpoIIIE